MLNAKSPTTISIFINYSIKRYFRARALNLFWRFSKSLKRLVLSHETKNHRLNFNILRVYICSIYVQICPVNMHSVMGSVQFVRVSIQYNINCILCLFYLGVLSFSNNPLLSNLCVHLSNVSTHSRRRFYQPLNSFCTP